MATGTRKAGDFCWINMLTPQPDSAREAVQLGRSLCIPPQDIPNVGRFCGITSPQGVTFFAIKYSS